MQSSAILLGLLLVAVLRQCQAVCPHGCRACTDGRFHCPGAQLDAIPDNIPKDTSTIDLTQNKISSLNNLPMLPDVQSFRMSLNQLRAIRGGAFDKMPAVMSLDLSMNAISKVYKHGLWGLKDLKSISLNGNNIQELGMIFWNTRAVNTIRLGNNMIKNIEEENFQKNDMIKMLDLSHNKISSIHGNAFKNLNMMRYLILSNNPLKKLDNLVFSSTMLSLADFSNCQLESVPRTMPASLTDFRLGNNMITKTEVRDFENITSLTLLTLNDNKISNVEHRSFDNLKNLKELWLSRNDLVYIPRGLPRGMVKLFIDNNVVVELEPRLFKENSSLKVLSLDSNKLRKVHQDSLKEVKQLEKLSFQGNEISLIDVGTFSDLPKLQSLTMTENPIQVFEKGAFNGLDSMTEIRMSYIEHSGPPTNKILQENFLLTMPNLAKVDLMSSVMLSKAFVDMFDRTTRERLDKVTHVNLQYSELTTLGEGIKKLFPNIKELLLDENLFHCDQKLLWLQDWMKTATDVSFYQYDEPKCSTPSSLKGRSIKDLGPHEFVAISETKAETYSNQKPAIPQSPSYSSETPKEEPINQPNTRQPQPPSGNSRQPQSGNSRQPPSGNSRQPQSGNSGQPPSGNSGQPPSGNSRQPVSGISGGRPSPNSLGGVRVVIKPPSGSKSKQIAKKDNSKMTKAERKAARKAERERKRRERLESRRRSRAKKDDPRRKKRRIRNERNKNCTTDKEGNRKCRRKNRCKVQSDGTTKCRKRKGKGKKQKKADAN